MTAFQYPFGGNKEACAWKMSKLALVLFCASLAAMARAGVLTRKGAERSNDVFTSFEGNLEALPLDNAKATNSVPEKIIEVLNSTTSNATDLEGIDANRKEEKSRSHPKPDKVPKNTVSISETTGSINDSEVPPLNSTSSDSFPSLEPSNETQEINWPPRSILNETEGMNWPLNDFLNETGSQVLDSNEALRSRSNAVNGQTEPTDSEVAEILEESFSNDSASVEGYGIENNSSSIENNSISIEKLDGSLNETEFVSIDNFSLNITEGTKLSENLTDESETLFTDSNPAVESKNESVEMDPLTRANFSDNFNIIEQNSSSVLSQNEASINTHELNSRLTNATEGIDVSLENNIKDMKTSLNVFNTSEEINNEEFLNNTSDLEKSFTISETEVSSINSSMEVNEESTPKPGIEGSFQKVPTQQPNGEGIFTNFGFDFLKNTQLAKNAVKAMEIFNLSDSITDHIIEENEFHSFLDTTPPPAAEKQPMNPLGMNSSGISESVHETEESVNETETSVNETSHLDIEGVTRLNDTVLSENSTNDTTNATTEDALKSNSTSVPNATGNSSVVESNPSCPPPGVCIFWFLAQDTCAVNSHCLGTRICCKIRCSKTCIEV